MFSRNLKLIAEFQIIAEKDDNYSVVLVDPRLHFLSSEWKMWKLMVVSV